MNKVTNLITQRSYRILGLLLITAIAATLSYQTYQGFEKAHVAQEGLSTCFTRINQSFTARMIEDVKSPFLKSNFTQVTEECMSKVISTSQELMNGLPFFVPAMSSEEAHVALNSLSQSGHFFHEELLKEMESWESFSNERTAHTIARYEKLERQKEKIMSQWTATRENINEGLVLLLIIYTISFIILGHSVALDIWEHRQRRKTVGQLEDEARELMARESLSLSQVFNIVRQVLVIHEIHPVKDLINFYAHKYDPDTKRNLRNVESEILQIQTDKAPPKASASNTLSNLERINLETVVSKVVDLLSKRIFSEGIRIDLNIDSGLYIWAREEAVEQVIYNIMVNAIQACTKTLDDRAIVIQSKVLGSSVILELRDTGIGFRPEMVNTNIGEVGDSHRYYGAGLSICKEFMKDFSGQLLLSNNYNHQRQVTGASVRLLFRRVPLDELLSAQPVVSSKQQKAPAQWQRGRIVSLVKGKKKDLIKELGAD